MNFIELCVNKTKSFEEGLSYALSKVTGAFGIVLMINNNPSKEGIFVKEKRLFLYSIFYLFITFLLLLLEHFTKNISIVTRSKNKLNHKYKFIKLSEEYNYHKRYGHQHKYIGKSTPVWFCRLCRKYHTLT